MQVRNAMKVMEVRFETLTDLPEEVRPILTPSCSPWVRPCTRERERERTCWAHTGGGRALVFKQFAGSWASGPPTTFTLPAPATSTSTAASAAFTLPAPQPLQLGMPRGIHAAAEVLPGLSADDVNAMLGITR
jgi:hypothetical protein